MNWHLLAHDGTIKRTVTAPDKPTAQRLLGPGPVVSAASYRLDRRFIRPRRRLKLGPSGKRRFRARQSGPRAT